RLRGRTGGPHARRPAAPQVRRRLPGRRPQRLAQGRARPPARSGSPARPRLTRVGVMPTTKFLLGEDQIPTHWVNLLPDLPGEPLPPLSPRTGETAGPH